MKQRIQKKRAYKPLVPYSIVPNYKWPENKTINKTSGINTLQQLDS